MAGPCAATNNNIVSMIYNFQQLNHQLSLAITQTRFLTSLNKLKRAAPVNDHGVANEQISE